MKKLQRIGIIGGMGNEAMVDLIEKIDAYPQSTQQEFIAFGNARLAYKPEEVGVTWQENDPVELRKRDTARFTLRLMQYLGANKLGLACNSAHELFRPICTELPIPFIDMLAQTASQLRGVEGKVLVLGVTGLVDSGLYQQALQAQGIEATRASEANQALVMDAIYNVDYGIKTAQITPQVEAQLCQVISDEYQKQGCTHVVLGCTELPLALSASRCREFKAQGLLPEAINVVDASQVLAHALLDTQETAVELAQPLSSYQGAHTDWFTPLAFEVENLSQAASIQKAIFSHSLAYLAKHNASLTGSYWHLPTLFFSRSAQDVHDKLVDLGVAIYSPSHDFTLRLEAIMDAYYADLLASNAASCAAS